MNSNHKALIIIAALSLTFITVSGIFNFWLSFGLGIFILSLCIIFRNTLMPAGHGANKVRILSITLAIALATSYGQWFEIIDTLFKSLILNTTLASSYPNLKNISFSQGPSGAVLLVSLLIVWIVNHYMADRTIAGNHPSPLKKDFPDLGFQTKLKAFCEALRQHLETTDREANWSPIYYADLEAEVEVMTNAGSVERKRIVDLQDALRAHKKIRSFLILGEPGSGKSVALRKLARDMLQEVGTSGRIPIYINLREWLPQAEYQADAWTKNNFPTLQDLENFVIENIKNRGDVFTEEFVDKYFRDLWQHGRLFFIFDSFDEIPVLLDETEDSPLLDSLSGLLHRFIATSIDSRGAVASRLFRRPSQAFNAQKTLEIRPLSEHRIETALTRFDAFTPDLRTRLFRERTDLIPVSRNPFLMTLLGEWVNENGNLPQTQAQLYESYLRSRIAKCENRIRKAGLTQQQVFKGAVEIALFVFNSPEYGLEAPTQVIGENVDSTHTEKLVEILSYARIARVTQGENKSFAFVHRRFLEYLVTTAFLENRDRLPEDHIPTDSRGRDAMVLYAQICEPEEAERLATLCWREIKQHLHDLDNRLRAIHCLRFLVDAFQGQRKPTDAFSDELATFIDTNIEHGSNILTAKICLEAAGLLSQEKAAPIILKAMDSSDAWLQETAFRACRHMPKLAPDLQKSLDSYVTTIPIKQFLHGYKSLNFSLSLSDGLKNTLSIARWRHIDLWKSLFALSLCFIISPLINAAGIIYGLLLSVTSTSVRKKLGTHTHLFNSYRTTTTACLIAVSLSILYEETDKLNSIKIFLSSIFQQELLYTNNNNMQFSFGEVTKWPISLITSNNIIISFLLFLIALGTIDWIWLYNFTSTITKSIKSRALFSKATLNTIKALVFSLAATLAAFALIFLIIKYVKKDWIFYIFAPLFAVVVITLIISITNHTYHFIKDWKYVSSITYSQKITRLELSRSFIKIHTLHWRLKYIQRISEQKITAAGQWPDEFSLGVGEDPAKTELARLEERWLNLDR